MRAIVRKHNNSTLIGNDGTKNIYEVKYQINYQVKTQSNHGGNVYQKHNFEKKKNNELEENSIISSGGGLNNNNNSSIIKTKRNISQIYFGDNTNVMNQTPIHHKKPTRKPGEAPNDDELICIPCENEIIGSLNKKRPSNKENGSNYDFHVIFLTKIIGQTPKRPSTKNPR